MVLKRDSLVFKIAYGVTDKKKVPDQTNICRLFWRCFSLSVSWFIVGIVLLALSLVAIPLALAVGTGVLLLFLLILAGGLIFFGYRPDSSFRELLVDLLDDGIEFIAIERWPKVRGRHLMPIWLYLAGALGYFSPTVARSGASLFTRAASAVWHTGEGAVVIVLIGVTIALSLLVGLLVWGWRQFWGSDFGKLTSAYLKAKKEKLCPIVLVEPAPATDKA